MVHFEHLPLPWASLRGIPHQDRPDACQSPTALLHAKRFSPAESYQPHRIWSVSCTGRVWIPETGERAQRRKSRSFGKS
eukprot:s880_g2.t1